MGFVYTFASSLDGKVFYVGKADLDERIRSHIVAASGNAYNISRVAQRIRSIWQQGGKVIIRKPVPYIAGMAVYRKERELINRYGYAQLVNLPPSQFGRDRGIYPSHVKNRQWQRDHAFDEIE